MKEGLDLHQYRSGQETQPKNVASAGDSMVNIRFLQGITAVSLIAVIILPAYTIFYLSPSFTALLKKHSEEKATRIASHLATEFLETDRPISRNTLSEFFLNNIDKIKDTFLLMDITLFAPSGEIVFADEPHAARAVHAKPFFLNKVAHGEILTKFATTDLENGGGRAMAAETMETYVPIMKKGRFLGALAIHFDVTAERHELKKLMANFHITLFLLTAGLLYAVVASLFHLNRMLSLQKNTELALRESEEQYRAIFESSPDAMVVLNAERFLDCNQAALELFGFTSKTDFTVCHLADVSPPTQPDGRASRAAAEQLIAKALKEGKNQFEWLHCKQDGTEFHAHVSLAAFNVHSEKVLQAVIQNITIRKWAEKVLMESEKRFADISYSMADWIFETNSKGEYTYSSGRVSSVLGYGHDELLGKTPFSLMAAEEAERIRPVLEKIFADRTNIIDLENWFIAKNGQKICFLTSAVPILDEAGSMQGYRGINKNITERKEAENALREREKYLQAIKATIQTGLVITDPLTGKITDTNPAAAEMVGSQEDDLIGRNFYKQFVFGETGSGMAMTPRSDAGQDDRTIQTANKGPMHVRRSYTTVNIAGRDHVVQSLLDITDIKNLLKNQEINIGLARSILGLINTPPQRYTALSAQLELCVHVSSNPCNAEGGDHFFVRRLAPATPASAAKIIVSIKDQSGHEVKCILRSIVTDLLHNALINSNHDASIEEVVALLNNAVGRSNLFKEDDFFTSLNAEINAETLLMRFVSTGHPPFLLIRGATIISLPEQTGPGSNLPIPVQTGLRYSAGEIQLQAGDKLIFYTDGLTDIPFTTQRKSLRLDELKEIVAGLITAKQQPPVADLTQGLLAAIAELGGEQIVPFIKNSTDDDVTVVGLEIENHAAAHEKTVRFKNLDEVDRFVSDFYQTIKPELEKHGFVLPEIRIRMALNEALVNAWKHGNHCRPDRTITVRWRFGSDLLIEVIDQGNGFDFRTPPDPTMVANRTNLSGRGIFIIRRFTDFIRWDNGGRHLKMAFRKRTNAGEKEYFSQAERLLSLWKGDDR